MRRAITAGMVVFLLAYAGAYGSDTARAGLSHRLPEAKLTNVTLSDAIQFLQDAGGLNIDVDWKSLAALNVTRDALINLNLHDVRIGKILSLILSQAAPGDALTYYVDDNVVEVTSQTVADQKLVTAVYYVEDLVSVNDNFDPTLTNVQNAQGGQSSGGGASNPFSASGTSSTAGNSADAKENKAQKLIKMIETIIRPEIWRDNGGPATIEYFNGNLIVSAPRSVQESIGGPLN
jgi:hypothetical protein